jgi:hypothetical protein
MLSYCNLLLDRNQLIRNADKGDARGPSLERVLGGEQLTQLTYELLSTSPELHNVVKSGRSWFEGDRANVIEGGVMEFIVAVCLLGLITGSIAKNKGHSFGKWWFYGAALFIVALPMAIMLKPVPGTHAAATDSANLRKCPKCAELIQNEASICRFCKSEVTPLPPQMPVKNPNNVPGWLVVVSLIIIGIFIYGKAHESGSSSGGGSSNSLPASPSATGINKQIDEKTDPPISNETVSQINAVRKAKAYLDHTAFSHDGLVEQLQYEQFSHTDAVYGVDNSGANWNEQAAKKAKEYMTQSSFSRGGLIEQLKYEKFTRKQAEYGVNGVGL